MSLYVNFLRPCILSLVMGCCLAGKLIPAFAESPADGDEFVISYLARPTSVDPNVARITPNVVLSTDIFQPLFGAGSDRGWQSDLLASWEAREDRTWVLTLKQGIYFHDGTELTSQDVIYTFDRIRQMAKSDYKEFVKRWESYEAPDKWTVKIVTKTVNANLPRDLGRIFIVRHRDDGPLATEHFMEGQGYIGSGPYRFAGQDSNGDIHLLANPDYHEGAPFLKRVRITRIADPVERIEALRTGTVQLAEGLTEQELGLLRPDDKVHVVRATSHRILHLHLDTYNDQSPYVRDNKGQPMSENPLKKRLVREALSLAINRPMLVDTILAGNGIPAGQYILPDSLGSLAGLEADRWDPDKARRLLAEAGYPDGFQLTLHGTNNRYLKDKAIIEAIARMWIEVGVKTTPMTFDRVVFFDKSAAHEYSASMLGVSTDGNLQAFLEVTICSQSDELGAFNDGRYSNPEVDELVRQARQDFNEVRRVRLLSQAMELAVNDYAVIPLYFEKVVWGMRSDAGIEFEPTRLGYTQAFDIRQAIKSH